MASFIQTQQSASGGVGSAKFPDGEGGIRTDLPHVENKELTGIHLPQDPPAQEPGRRRCEYLVDIANNYNDNEKHYDEYESVLDATVNKVKAETKAVINKLKDADTDLGFEYSKEQNNLKIKEYG